MRAIYLLLTSVLLMSFIRTEQPKGTQRASYYCTVGKPIDGDINIQKSDKLYFEFHQEKELLKANFPNYYWKNIDQKDFFTAYLVNTESKIFNCKRQDGSLIMIQEAKDENGIWAPIEHWVYSWCGNSYFDPLKLESGHYATFPVKRYSGSYKTEIRLKLHTGTEVIYSDSFTGSINRNQFKKEVSEQSEFNRYNANYLDE
jgi:hypothetical protein